MTIPTTLDDFAAMPWPTAVAWLMAINVLMFVLSMAAGHLLVWVYRDRPVTPPPRPVERTEIVLAAICVLLNGGVAVAGFFLWRAGIIRVSQDLGWRVALDAVVLLVAMDLAMYAFHRIAHLPWLYGPLHSAHHRYDNPRPLNLFVLNPAEVLGFGALWLIVLIVYPATWVGILIYLALNLVFGTLGHLGVEPFPASWARLPVLRHVGSSTFHADHHQDGHVNYGFYSTIWDRIFHTLGPRSADPPTPEGRGTASSRGPL